MYLGEIVRNVLLALVDAAPKPLLFKGKATSVLNTQYALDTSVLSDVETAFIGDTAFEEFVKHDFTSETAPGIEARLERVRDVIVKEVGYDSAQVTLQDAFVGMLSYPLAQLT